jgi:hypothetical protein
VHLERLVSLATATEAPPRGANPGTAESRPLARQELDVLRRLLAARVGRGGDAVTLAHVRDLLARIAEALDPR